MARKSIRKKRFVVCIRNTGYPAALELRKIYQALPDHDAEGHGLIRVIDESGEDYLYPTKFFISVDLSQPVQNALRRATG
jgi:hypothetical protein